MTENVKTTWGNTTPEVSGLFINVRPDIDKTVRLLGDPVRLMKIFVDNKQCILINDIKTGEDLQEAHPGRISKIQKRFVCYCIDRDDSKIKILNMPTSLAQKFGNRVEALGTEISKEIGCDWKISTNGKTGIECRYEATYLFDSELTDAECEGYKLQKKDLAEEYKGKTYDEAMELIK